MQNSLSSVGGRGGGGGHDQHHVEIGKRRTDEAVPARQDVRENQPGAVGAGADAVRRLLHGAVAVADFRVVADQRAQSGVTESAACAAFDGLPCEGTCRGLPGTMQAHCVKSAGHFDDFSDGGILHMYDHSFLANAGGGGGFRLAACLFGCRIDLAAVVPKGGLAVGVAALPCL